MRCFKENKFCYSDVSMTCPSSFRNHHTTLIFNLMVRSIRFISLSSYIFNHQVLLFLSSKCCSVCFSLNLKCHIQIFLSSYTSNSRKSPNCSPMHFISLLPNLSLPSSRAIIFINHLKDKLLRCTRMPFHHPPHI